MERCESTIAAAVVTPAATIKAALALSRSRVEAMLRVVTRGGVSGGARFEQSCRSCSFITRAHVPSDSKRKRILVSCKSRKDDNNVAYVSKVSKAIIQVRRY